MSELNVIVGLGLSGLSCADFLATQKRPFALMDTRDNPPHLQLVKQKFPNVEIALGGLNQTLLDKASQIILSPGIALNLPAIAEQIKQEKSVIGDIELFAQATHAPIIAITGTNAKSTVTTLVGLMAKASGFNSEMGGNLGVPALHLLMQHPQANLFVLELSSFQLETTFSLRAKVASILNISPDHMDRYATLDDYINAKHRIYQHAEKVVENKDDVLTTCHDPRLKEKWCFTLGVPKLNEFGLRQHAGKTFLAFGATPLLATDALPVAGKHAYANALAALSIGHAFGFPLEPMLEVLSTFKGLPHRCQLVRERQGVKWFNDSKGTNVGATLAAIQGLGPETQGKLVLIAGGVGKNADFQPLVSALSLYARAVILIGEAARVIAETIDEKVPIVFAKTMEDAVGQAARAAQPKDNVLLSPACASFDMFNNFEHRGQVFTELVNQLP